MNYKKKLIEVTIPIEAINEACSREKGNPFLKGHPRSIHVWWARRPLPACRAVILASLIDDPSSHPELFPDEESQQNERARLFKLIERVVPWEASKDDDGIALIKKEIEKSNPDGVPALLDPFSGGASIPIEGVRLGLEVRSADLNPVAVLIGKALLELPSRFKNSNSIQPKKSNSIDLSDFGLADDIEYYGSIIQSKIEVLLSKTYDLPINELRKGLESASAIAWIWARTVRSPDPSLKGIHVPLAKTFLLSKKNGKSISINPLYDKKSHAITYEVINKKNVVSGTVGRNGARCIISGSPITLDYIRSEGAAGKLGHALMAVVVKNKGKKQYISPIKEDSSLVSKLLLDDVSIDTDLPDKALGFRVQAYGMKKHRDLFSRRQLYTLSKISDYIDEVSEMATKDALASGMDKGVSLERGGKGALAYSQALKIYLALAFDKVLDFSNTICTWNSKNENIRNIFSKQTISMTWDYAETNLLEGGVTFGEIAKSIARIVRDVPRGEHIVAVQEDATSRDDTVKYLISTDPPYYDNIGYADLSDFFYVWLRKNLKSTMPSLFSTTLSPKEDEIVANEFRFGGDKKVAAEFFESRIKKTFESLLLKHDRRFPLTVFYAFKQTEDVSDPGEESASDPLGVVSTGWETMLEGLLQAGWSVLGTIPMRTERGVRSRAISSNALATSIILVCRPREKTAGVATKRDVISDLRKSLPRAIKELKEGGISAVDLQQAAIGPGMAVFSSYEKVLEADDSEMSVRSALAIINQVLDEVLSDSDSTFDPMTRWALTWFEQFGYDSASFGDANTLAQAKNISVEALASLGLIESRAGTVRLLKRSQMKDDWSPGRNVSCQWVATQQLIKHLEESGEMDAGLLLKDIGNLDSVCRDLAFRLFSICESKGWSGESVAINSLIVSWSEILKIAMGQVGKQGKFNI